MNFLEGQTLLFDKAKSWTSFDLVKKVRNTIKIKKVGHAGTLDPLATGLLIICTGKHTKRISQYQEMEKEYVVEFKLGAKTASYDAEMPEENKCDASHIVQEDILKVFEGYLGEIEQMPPAHSAIKVGGKRAYELARAGKEVKLRSRKVFIYDLVLLDADSPDAIQAKITCSKGTYIRSLVHDWGQDLGVGAYIRELRRTRIGNFKVEESYKIEDFVNQFKPKLSS